MARGVAILAAIAVSLLAVSGAGGALAQTPKRGGTLVIGTRTQSEPACLNVFVCDLTLGGLLHEVLPGAFEVKPDATFRPDLVSGAAVVSKSPFVLVYRIRPEAHWSDGLPVTASDFVFTDRVERKYSDDAHRTYVRSVVPLDTKTVRVVLRERFLDWRYSLFSTVLPRHALAGEDFTSAWQDGIDNPTTGKPIGSGPFLVGPWDRGRQITLVRNPRYWRAHRAYLGRIVYRFLPQEDVADALRSGEIDMIDPSPQALRDATAEFRQQPTPGITVLDTLLTAFEQVAIRQGQGGNPALRIRLVRQALAYGIDRVVIARTIGALSGASAAARKPDDSFVYLPNSPYYQPNWSYYRYRPALARRLLEQAGCRLGQDGIYSCAGTRLSLRFVTVGGVVSRQRTVELAQAQLRRIGVEVTPVFAPFPTFVNQILPSGDFDLALYGFGVGPSAAAPLPNFGCQEQGNDTGYCDRLMTRDLVQVDRIVDDRRRVGLMNRIDVRLAKAVPRIPLFQHTGLFAFKATVRGVVANGAYTWAWNAEDWWLAR